MIYASLQSVQAWHTKLTPLCYRLFAIAGGFLAAAFFAFCGGGNSFGLCVLAILFLATAWVAKIFWRRNMLETVPLSTPESATGLGTIGRVRLLERPHVNENYLTSEMGFKVARKHADKLWKLAVSFGGVLPGLLLLVALIAGQGLLAGVLAGLALLSHMLGMLTERWLFFAEARHAVMNYYGD
jgi:DMSO reductase anchor subunit